MNGLTAVLLVLAQSNGDVAPPPSPPPLVRYAPSVAPLTPPDHCPAQVEDLQAEVTRLESLLEACRATQEKPRPRSKPAQLPNAAPATPKTVDIELVQPSANWTEIVLTYTNLTKQTFARLVSIECVGRTRAGAMMGMVTRSFFAHEYGPIAPGFQKRQKMSIAGSADTVECRVSDAR